MAGATAISFVVFVKLQAGRGGGTHAPRAPSADQVLLSLFGPSAGVEDSGTAAFGSAGRYALRRRHGVQNVVSAGAAEEGAPVMVSDCSELSAHPTLW
jgi:hypothetical protein